MYHIITIKFLERFFGKPDMRNNRLWEKYVEYLLPLILNTMVASGIGHTFEIEIEMIMFSIFYTVLRTSNGGNYYKINVKNTLFFWSSAVVVLKTIPYIIAAEYGKILLLIFILGSLAIVFIFLPVSIRQREFPKNVRKTILKTSYAVILLESLPLLIGTFFCINRFIVAAVSGVLLQSISLIWVQEREWKTTSLYNKTERCGICE